MSEAGASSREPEETGPEAPGSRARIRLGRVVDLSVLRTLVDASARMTGLTVAILDVDGEVLIRSEWQEICLAYHRVNPETAAACKESDTVLTSGIPLGRWNAYRCRNGLWDVATPIVVSGQHVANLFVGQFFYDDEAVDEAAFREKARLHGFDGEPYLSALARVPRWSRERVATAMAHYAGLANIVSTIGTSNVELRLALAEKERLLESLRESAACDEALFEHSPVAIWEEDFSAVKIALDGLREAGVADFRAFFETHPEEVLRCASRVRVLRVNQTSVDVLEAKSKEGILVDLPASFSEASLDVFRDELVALAEGSTRFEGEFQFPAPVTGRKVLHVFVSVVPGFERTLGRVLVSFLDVTERKRVEEALRTSEERLRAAAESADLGTWLYDRMTARVRLDERARNHFGQELLDVSFDEVLAMIHPEDAGRIREATMRVFGATSGERILDVEFRVRKRSGEVRWVSTSARGTHAGEGPERGAAFVIGTIVDVTARKRADELKLRAQKLEALGTLAGGIAHDFNNILFAIRGNASLAATELSEDHPVRSLVAEIDRAGLRAAALVRQILAFSRPEGTVRAILHLGTVVDEILKLLRSSLPVNIQIHTKWGDEAPPAAVDPGQVQQVLVNLVTNAAHAIGARPGRIDIQLSAAEVGEQTERIGFGPAPGRYAMLSVTDDGGGMDPATLARAFDPFFTTKPSGQGTGLGLSVVHGIMKGHAGSAAVRSRPGTGTTVELYFPAAEAPVTTAPPPRRAEEGPRSGALLYVDDDEAILLLARRALGRLGYRVTTHGDPRAAVDAFRARPDGFDAVITDISMPEMSGFEVAREILGVRATTPVVVTSGYIRPEDEAQAALLGVRALIAKPNTVDELAEALDRIFRAEPA